MGNYFSNLWNKLFETKTYRILLLGLDNAGKTTILYKLKLGEVVSTVPTIGFNVESIDYKNIKFNCWDIGGQQKIRSLWRHYYLNTDAIIFVLDSTDVNRLSCNLNNVSEYEESVESELNKLLENEELKDCALLVLANKQDQYKSLKIEEISNLIGLNKIKNRTWKIYGTNAIKGEGLYEALEWMTDYLKNKSTK